MTDERLYGPIDFVLIEFGGDSFKGQVAGALLDLVERDVVRIYDILVVRKAEDGSVSGLSPGELELGRSGGFGAFAGARSGLLSDDDVREAGAAMRRGSIAIVIVYENAWAIPFVRAAREAGGELIASARLSAQDIMDAVDKLDAVT